MFTGIIQSVGHVAAHEVRGGDARLVIDAPGLDLGDVAVGDSIAVAGVCLTAIALDGSCRTPIAAFSRLEREELFLLCELLKPDGTQAWRLSETIRLGADPATAAKALGARIGGRLHDIAVAERIL